MSLVLSNDSSICDALSPTSLTPSRSVPLAAESSMQSFECGVGRTGTRSAGVQPLNPRSLQDPPANPGYNTDTEGALSPRKVDSIYSRLIDLKGPIIAATTASVPQHYTPSATPVKHSGQIILFFRFVCPAEGDSEGGHIAVVQILNRSRLSCVLVLVRSAPGALVNLTPPLPSRILCSCPTNHSSSTSVPYAIYSALPIIPNHAYEFAQQPLTVPRAHRSPSIERYEGAPEPPRIKLPLTRTSAGEESFMSGNIDEQNSSPSSRDPIPPDWSPEPHQSSLYLADKIFELVSYLWLSLGLSAIIRSAFKLSRIFPGLCCSLNIWSTSRTVDSYATPTCLTMPGPPHRPL
ncbi:hypothetical protein BJ322DRAFT_1103514 [Thelephora terrestris]|uniref:Uncharacterized protein n=1 Tax=Thelephora terrestris TaxID=56493 RepID=A0A9P6LDF2_9AGAM|nr:hypothetical protein BJ322DRAFT_1103514 [Thelephora terrestris]